MARLASRVGTREEGKETELVLVARVECSRYTPLDLEEPLLGMTPTKE
jgi:hypothetical protein